MISARSGFLLIAASILAACSSAYVGAAPVLAAEPAEKMQPQNPAGAKHNDMKHSHGHGHSKNEPRPYHANADAWADVDNAMSAARAGKKMTIVAMGANWCHDSRGLAAQFEKDRFQKLISENYELVYVDVGKRNRNIDIANNFGIDKIAGTPTVFVISFNGEVLNLDTAPTWRNAASRSEDDIYDYFENFTKIGGKWAKFYSDELSFSRISAQYLSRSFMAFSRPSPFGE